MTIEQHFDKLREQLRQEIRSHLSAADLSDSDKDALVEHLAKFINPILNTPLTMRAPDETNRQPGKPIDRPPPPDHGNLPPEVF